MKLRYIYFTVIIFIISISQVRAQQGTALTKIKIDKKGNVEILDMDTRDITIDQRELESTETLRQEKQLREIMFTESVNSNRHSLANYAYTSDLQPVREVCYYTIEKGFLEFYVTIVNNGESNCFAHANWLVYYLSTNGDITNNDTRIGRSRIGSLCWQERYSVIKKLNVKPYPGTWYVGFYIDALNEVHETNEDNNRFSFSYRYKALPDLVPLTEAGDSHLNHSEYTYSPPNLDIMFLIANKGGADAYNFEIAYYLLSTTAPTYEILIGISEFPHAYAFGPYELTWTNIDVSDYPGTWYIACIVDEQDKIGERNENNNAEILYPAFTIEPTEYPDLIVTNVSIVDAEGPLIHYRYNLKNQGDTSTKTSFQNYIYLSLDTEILKDDDDYKIDEKLCSELSPDIVYTSDEYQTTVSGVPAGEYYLGVYTDGSMVISESNEENNTNYNKYPFDERVIIYPPPAPVPDLIVSNVKVIDVAPPYIDFEYSITNLGNGSAGGSFANHLVFSIDQIIGNSDDYIITEYLWGNINSGAIMHSGPRNKAFGGVPPGEYYVCIYTDGGQEISESNESNNTGYDKSTMVVIYDDEPDEPEGNMIRNWTFSEGKKDWQFSTMGSGNGIGSIERSDFHAHIISGGANLWEVRLYQEDLIIVQGKTYTASFQAKATSPRNIWVTVGTGTEPFLTYNDDSEFFLSTSWKTYTYTFTMVYNTTNNNAMMTFNLGTENADVYLDNISLVEEEI